MACMTAPC